MKVEVLSPTSIANSISRRIKQESKLQKICFDRKKKELDKKDRL